MSVNSPRVKSVSSILNAPGVRSQLLKQSKRVHFKLPKNIKDILLNFEARKRVKDYKNLVSTLRYSNIKDNDLVHFLCEIRQCVSSLGPIHKSFIEVLLEINWLNKSPRVISAYKIFVEDLISAQIHHGEFIMDKLVERFKPTEGDYIEWKTGGCRAKVTKRLNDINDVLCRILNIVPMSSKLLLELVRTKFPYMNRGTHVQVVYVHALLQLSENAPQLRPNILFLIINRLMVLDVNIPQSEGNTSENVSMKYNKTDINYKNKKNVKQLNPLAHTLDLCMQEVFDFIYNTCYVKGKLDKSSLISLYFELLKIFEIIILPTHASQYVQYIMFYICSFKVIVVKAFLDWLCKKTTDPNVPAVLRSTAAAYIADLVSIASFVSIKLVETMQLKLANWIYNYIEMHERSDSASDYPRNHRVFYSVCQALFSIIISRYKDLSGIDNIKCLHHLYLTKIITCKLNPLKTCQSDVVQNFADISQMYQLADCYTIIEHNARNLPVIHETISTDLILDRISPFSTYTLNYSGKRLISLFNDCSKNNVSRPMTRPETDGPD